VVTLGDEGYSIDSRCVLPMSGRCDFLHRANRSHANLSKVLIGGHDERSDRFREPFAWPMGTYMQDEEVKDKGSRTVLMQYRWIAGPLEANFGVADIRPRALVGSSTPTQLLQPMRAESSTTSSM
jgi:hypothetical protein